MTQYTHAFIYSTKHTITIEELCELMAGDDRAAIKAKAEVDCQGFLVISDLDAVVWDKHGRPSRNGGGWSYGHIQRGWICAGAGGPNSLRIIKIEA